MVRWQRRETERQREKERNGQTDREQPSIQHGYANYICMTEEE